jgi:hypothetical protein
MMTMMIPKKRKRKRDPLHKKGLAKTATLVYTPLIAQMEKAGIVVKTIPNLINVARAANN